ncbi:MAG: 2-dehydropantoate 2-reductase [Burkholderiaceae bacterium]|nr:2-dehydropantoate 2-reductase [Burkholderiaceae bacterium]
MKTCIYGAGAIGGWLGVRLAQAGAELSVVARGATLEAIGQHGLRLDMEGAVHTVRPQVSQDPAALGKQDLVIVAVKAPAMAQVAQAIAPLVGPGTVVLTAMNGVPWWFLQGFGGEYAGRPLASVDPQGTIAAAIAAPHVVGGVVHASCAMHSPGFVQHHFGKKLILGEPSGGVSGRVRRIGALLERGGVEVQYSEQIQKDVWYKLWGNMTMNPLSAITGATSDRVLADPLVRGFASSVMLEAREIGARLGIPIADAPDDRHKITAKLGAFKTSMLQDVEAGRPVELDALVGAVRELGSVTGVPTPQTDILYGLARLHAQMRGLY